MFLLSKCPTLLNRKQPFKTSPEDKPARRPVIPDVASELVMVSCE